MKLEVHDKPNGLLYSETLKAPIIKFSNLKIDETFSK